MSIRRVLSSSAKAAATALRTVRPAPPTERTRKDIAWDLVRDIRALDERVGTIALSG